MQIDVVKIPKLCNTFNSSTTWFTQFSAEHIIKEVT